MNTKECIEIVELLLSKYKKDHVVVHKVVLESMLRSYAAGAGYISVTCSCITCRAIRHTGKKLGLVIENGCVTSTGRVISAAVMQNL